MSALYGLAALEIPALLLGLKLIEISELKLSPAWTAASKLALSSVGMLTALTILFLARIL